MKRLPTRGVCLSLPVSKEGQVGIMPKKLFVSYAQAPEEHKQRVAELVASLRSAGLLVTFDQDVTSPQGPPEGWPQWMLNQIEQADWVLVICNEVYYRRFRGREEPGRGLGARWEGAIIGQALYNQGMLNQKFIPVLLGDELPAHIPEPLQGATYYRLPNDQPKLMDALGGSSTAKSTASPSSAKRKPPTPKVARRRAPTAAGPVWPEIVPYALLSLGSFLTALILVGLLLWKAELLSRLGLTGNFYYLALLPLGLAVSGFLFGSMRSFARYRGKHLGGVLELGVPIVGFALVICGGFFLPPPASNFPLTVFVHGQAGPQDLILRGQGAVLLDLGSERRSAPIGDMGQAFFPEVPASFRGQAVSVGLDAKGYELVDSARKSRLDSTSLYVMVRKQPEHLKGRIQDEQGESVAGARITVAGLSASTNSAGRFDLIIPGDRLQDDLVLEATADGYSPWKGSVTLNSNDAEIILARRREG